MNLPKCLLAVMVPAMLTTGCLSALGSGSRNVPLGDFSTKPTIEIDWPEMTLKIPPSNAASVGSVSPRVKVEGESIIIQAIYVLSTKSAVKTFNLKKLGISKDKASSSKVFWLNPDGTKKLLEVTTISKN